MRRYQLPVFIVLGIAWAGVIAFGMLKLSAYANTPGAGARFVGTTWPTKTFIPRKAGAPTLLVFLHPDCPCSQATVGELEKLLPEMEGKVQTVVAFTSEGKLDYGNSAWRKWQPPGQTSLFWDDYGRAADQFGARTSGQTFLFAADGELLYAGGLTPARGHAGESAGHEAIRRLLAGQPSKLAQGKVFGCALFSANRNVAGIAQ